MLSASVRTLEIAMNQKLSRGGGFVTCDLESYQGIVTPARHSPCDPAGASMIGLA